MKILVSDKLSKRGLEILNGVGSLQVDVKVGLKPEELKAVIGQYHGLVIRSATKVTPEIIAAANNLKVIGRAGIGVDNVDLPAADKKGIVVMNTPEGNMITTAEHAFGLMISLARKVPQATMSMKAGKWEKNAFMGVELYQKTLGLIGMGRIGGVMARRARGFEMNVIAYDPYLSKEVADKLEVALVGLEELYKRSDFISIHAPKTPETHHMIGETQFKKMKKGVRIINCARGGIVVEKDLAQALRDGNIAGAALDVFEEEPPPKDCDLLGLDGFICTPHLGASTDEAQENVAIAVAEQIVEFFTTGQVRNSVNIPPISAEMMARLKPFLTLAERMGMFQAQLLERGVKKISIHYFGEVTGFNTEPLTRSILKGFLGVIVGDSVNFVNAPTLAKERGIEVVVSSDTTPKNFASLVSLVVQTDQGSRVVDGTVMGMNEPRIVRIENCYLEAVLTGNLLVFWNKDAPGVIGNIGTYLGNKEVNIGGFQLGRTAPMDQAVCIVNVDSPLTPGMLQDICKLPNILSAKMVTL